MTDKELLAGELHRRAKWMAIDCYTFFRVRHDGLENHEAGKGASELEVGGGNFLMMTALMNVLGLAAKVHLWLTAPDEFATEADQAAVREAKKRVAKEIPDLKTTVKSGWTEWRVPRVGDCNEERAFKKLVGAVRGAIDLGVPEDKAIEVWKTFRNPLTHMAWPEGSVAVDQLPGGPASAEMQARSSGPPPFRFLPENGIWQCNVDRLTMVMMSIVEWVCKQIEACADDDRVKKAVGWITGQEKES